MSPKPFVKWAGGKRQLIRILEKNLPKTFGAYYEPFIGGGALLFHILSRHDTQRCHISDLNSILILAYETIRDNVDDLVLSLKRHANNYLVICDDCGNSKGGNCSTCNGCPEKNTAYYYSVRDTDPQDEIEQVSRLIFLNKTCFNGLYRVNSKGKFNVPHGNYARPTIIHEENLRAVSLLLRSRHISMKYADFEEAVVGDDCSGAMKGDLVYFDPPYHPLNSTSNFTSYTYRNFDYDELVRLASLCRRLDSRGCHVLLSNSDSPQVRELFQDGCWRIQKIRANRSINSNAKKRVGHYELLIKNYDSR